MVDQSGLDVAPARLLATDPVTGSCREGGRGRTGARRPAPGTCLPYDDIPSSRTGSVDKSREYMVLAYINIQNNIFCQLVRLTLRTG